MPRIIFHIDVNSAFLSWSAVIGTFVYGMVSTDKVFVNGYVKVYRGDRKKNIIL